MHLDIGGIMNAKSHPCKFCRTSRFVRWVGSVSDYPFAVWKHNFRCWQCNHSWQVVRRRRRTA